MLTLALIAPVMVSLSVLLIFYGLATRSSTEFRERMQLYSTSGYYPVALEELELQVPFTDRVLKPLVMRVVRVFAGVLPGNRVDKLRHRLLQAGHPGGLSAADFVGIKGWMTVLASALAGFYWYMAGMSLAPQTILALGMVVAIAFMLPDIWLSRRITRRHLELTNALPDSIDMLTIAVEAGLSFDQGLGEIVSRWDNDLSREFRRVLYEIGLGKSRREALENLSERTQVQDIVSFVTAVNHAEELGASLGRVLTIQSQEMRVRRRQRAQEAANKVPIKMMFPMVFLIFPALFAVILGPGVPRLFRALGVDVGG